MPKVANFFALCSIHLCLALLAGCAGPAEDACGLSGEVPTTDDIASARVTADLDGSPFNEAGSWRAPPGGGFNAGLLEVQMANDENGDDTATLISEGTFPICVTIGERSETVGQAIDVAYVSDASNGGAFVILAEEDDEIVGRFEFTLSDPNGDTKTYSDGLFRVPQR